VNDTLPQSQYAVQLVGPSELTLNTDKAIPQPGPRQILAKVECTGLCFSDLKLLKQFTGHARKSAVVKGIDPAVLGEIPSYVPGEAPTVPGHEAVLRIIAVGDQVERHTVGERVLVQADWRELKTKEANGAFGYDFEGGLQEYVLLDERVVIEPSTGQRYLIPANEDRSASAIALVEPWACVEDAYVTVERTTIKPGGRLAVVVEPGCEAAGVEAAYGDQPPAEVRQITPQQIDDLDEEAWDDIVYFGANKSTVEALCGKLAAGGIFNIVTCGGQFGGPVSIDVGRVHYGGTRYCGTTGSDAADSYRHIPQTGEIRDGDSILVVGAGGPMGQMHVIRLLTTGHKGLTLVGTDFDNPRLESLHAKADPLARKGGATLSLVNPNDNPIDQSFSYVALMAPVPQLVSQAIVDAADGCRINIFAGIPAGTRADLDLDAYLAKHCWMIGTSGSTIEDIKIVLDKVQSGQMDTNLSVDAVSGMAGAIEGIKAVEDRTLAGKIIVYPQLHEMGLIPLEQLGEQYPTVAEKLADGVWTLAAEQELLRVAK
jgi:threonine dehydrogenase-like Zn-dependent dehydrogenase